MIRASLDADCDAADCSRSGDGERLAFDCSTERLRETLMGALRRAGDRGGGDGEAAVGGGERGEASCCLREPFTACMIYQSGPSLFAAAAAC